ncbi:hypothetical protein Tco_1082622 [Tanacetum coccineum]|uniref:Uncharacterized protein n=1 Tax=Tanacetum coccineum TaxID=301880 RepID=A0ABQ5I2L9_9ASTR
MKPVTCNKNPKPLVILDTFVISGIVLIRVTEGSRVQHAPRILEPSCPRVDREPSCLEGEVGFVEVFKEYEIGDVREEELEEEEEVVEVEELGVEYFDKFPTRNELAYHKYLLRDPSPPFCRRYPIIIGGNPSNLKIPCNIGYVHVWKAYINLNFPVNIMSRMHCNWIKKRKLEPKRDPKDRRRISNFTGRIRGMHIFVENFIYITDFLIVDDIISAIDHCLSHVALEKPFVEVSNMTCDPSLGIVKFRNGVDKVAYQMPHKIEKF